MKKIWKWITNESNNRGVTLIVIIAGFIVGLLQVHAIVLNLSKIQADTIETKQVIVPTESTLKYTDSKTGSTIEQIKAGSKMPIIELGDRNMPSGDGGCIDINLTGTTGFVHISPHVAGTAVFWEEGLCPTK